MRSQHISHYYLRKNYSIVNSLIPAIEKESLKVIRTALQIFCGKALCTVQRTFSAKQGNLMMLLGNL